MKCQIVLSPKESTCMKCQILLSPKESICMKCQILLSPKETICMKCQILLSPKETICMKCQILFSRKNKKNISKCHLLKFLPSMQSIKVSESECSKCPKLSCTKISDKMKQCRPRADCCKRSKLIRVYTVCHSTKYSKKKLYKTRPVARQDSSPELALIKQIKKLRL